MSTSLTLKQRSRILLVSWKEELGYSRFAFSKARGFTGGIALGWKVDLMQIFIINRHFQYIQAQITMEDGKIWYLTTVYVSPLDDRNKKLWMDLTSIATSMDSGWIVGRDFNDFLHLNGKRYGLLASL